MKKEIPVYTINIHKSPFKKVVVIFEGIAMEFGDNLTLKTLLKLLEKTKELIK